MLSGDEQHFKPKCGELGQGMLSFIQMQFPSMCCLEGRMCLHKRGPWSERCQQLPAGHLSLGSWAPCLHLTFSILCLVKRVSLILNVQERGPLWKLYISIQKTRRRRGSRGVEWSLLCVYAAPVPLHTQNSAWGQACDHCDLSAP